MGSFCRQFVPMVLLSCVLVGCVSASVEPSASEDRPGGAGGSFDVGEAGGAGGGDGEATNVVTRGGAAGSVNAGGGGGSGGAGGTSIPNVSSGQGGVAGVGGAGGAAGSGVVAKGSLIFVRAQPDSAIEWTCDGRSWKAANEVRTDQIGFRFVDQAAGVLIATGGGNETGSDIIKVHTSEDGVNWTPRITGRGNWMSAAGAVQTATGPVWVVAGGNGERRYSRDRGVTWSRPTSGPCTARWMSTGADRAVVICDEGTAILKPSTGAEPLQWLFQGGNGDGWGRAAYGNGRFVAVWGQATRTRGCKVLVDGSDTWQSCGKGQADIVMFDGSWFYISGDVGDTRWSQDGFTWVKRPDPAWRGSGGYFAGADNVYVRRDAWNIVAARVPPGVCL